jgi:hypothetical protein
MIKNELELRDHIALLLEKEGFAVQKEFKVPEGYRVDILAEKDNKKLGIEVKINQRGISDDISKCSILHKMPEFDYFYVAAPKILIHSELLAYAKRIRIGIIGVEGESLEWLQKSEELKSSYLLGGGSLPNQEYYPGAKFEVSKEVIIEGEKIVRNLEIFFIPSGPFITAPRHKSRFKKSKLKPKEKWDVTFRIKIKKSIRVETYPLYISCTADKVETSHQVWHIKIVAMPENMK